jgi:riboflavin kinase/FMN adenylyltransferase
MQLVLGIGAVSESLMPSAVTVGNFDGVHRGHQALLGGVVLAARQRDVASVALTFDPHPAQVLAPDRAPEILTPTDRRLELMAEAGLDGIVLQPFDTAFSRLTADEFVERVLRGSLGARCVVAGPDFRYGAGRVGTVDSLEGAGFEVVRIPPVLDEGAPISSSRIRGALRQGDVAVAARMLGHDPEIIGQVVQGQGLGRQIGVPTANLDTGVALLPADGVYAGRATVAEGLFRAVINVGVRPTLGAGRAIEVHLLDFEGSLYGQRLVVQLERRLRDERRFPSLEALREQIARDIDLARTT